MNKAPECKIGFIQLLTKLLFTESYMEWHAARVDCHDTEQEHVLALSWAILLFLTVSSDLKTAALIGVWRHMNYFFFIIPQLYLWGSPFLSEIFADVTVF